MAVLLTACLLSVALGALAILDPQDGKIYDGRSSNYGPTDQFASDWGSGSCKCWGDSNYQSGRPCFDSIGTPSHIAAVNTNDMDFTATCGTCLRVQCTNGPTRGLANSEFPTPGCLAGNRTVFVQITDSCPVSAVRT